MYEYHIETACTNWQQPWERKGFETSWYVVQLGFGFMVLAQLVTNAFLL